MQGISLSLWLIFLHKMKTESQLLWHKNVLTLYRINSLFLPNAADSSGFVFCWGDLRRVSRNFENEARRDNCRNSQNKVQE